MSVLAQICVIFAVCLASEGIAAVLPFSFPASVIGMLLLLVLLGLKAVRPRQLEQTSSLLMNNMAMFFIPACVGIIRYADVLLANFWVIVLISILTTPLVFFVTGHVVQLTMKLMGGKGRETDA